MTSHPVLPGVARRPSVDCWPLACRHPLACVGVWVCSSPALSLRGAFTLPLFCNPATHGSGLPCFSSPILLQFWLLAPRRFAPTLPDKATHPRRRRRTEFAATTSQNTTHAASRWCQRNSPSCVLGYWRSEHGRSEASAHWPRPAKGNRRPKALPLCGDSKLWGAAKLLQRGVCGGHHKSESPSRQSRLPLQSCARIHRPRTRSHPPTRPEAYRVLSWVKAIPPRSQCHGSGG